MSLTTQSQHDAGKTYAIRSYRDVAAEMKRRYGITITHAGVRLICERAEQKLREGLAEYATHGGGR